MKALKIILLAMAVFAVATSARAKSIEGVEEEEVKNIEDSNVATTTGGEGEDDYSCFPFIFNPGTVYYTNLLLFDLLHTNPSANTVTCPRLHTQIDLHRCLH